MKRLFEMLLALSLFIGTAQASYRSPTLKTETIAVTAPNTLASLSLPYSGMSAQMIVNGVAYTDRDSNLPFSISGKVVTWNSSATNYYLYVGDVVTITYSPTGPF